MVIVDAHLDLAYNVMRGRDVRMPAAEQPVVGNETATVGLPDLARGRIDLICGTVFCPPARYGRDWGYSTAEEAWKIAQEQIGWYLRQVQDGLMELVTDAEGVPETKSDRKKGQKFILLLEGADCVREPGDVKRFWEQGVRIIGLPWRKTRMAGGTNFPGPITEEGKAVVRAMDELKMIHDTSHLAEESFWQLLEMTGGPVMASHSNCRAIVPTDRQLSDEMIRALVDRGGVIGINFYDEFLLRPEVFKKRRVVMADVVEHIDHMCQLAGSARHVAIGTDADGGVGRDEIPAEMTTIADLSMVGEGLEKAGYSGSEVMEIMGGNWVRFFKEKLPGSTQ